MKLDAGQVAALSTIEVELSTIEAHTRSLNALISAQRLPLEWLVVSDRTAPFRSSILGLVAGHNRSKVA